MHTLCFWWSIVGYKPITQKWLWFERTVEWPAEDLVTTSVPGNVSFLLKGSSISFASVSNVMLSLLEPDAIQESSRVKGAASFNIITTQRLFDFCSHNFNFVCLKDWKECFHLGTQQWFHWNWKFKNTAWPCWVPPAAVSAGKEKGHLLTERLIPDYQGEVTLLLHSKAVRTMHMEPQYSFRCLLGISICNSKRFWKLSPLRKVWPLETQTL